MAADGFKRDRKDNDRRGGNNRGFGDRRERNQGGQRAFGDKKDFRDRGDRREGRDFGNNRRDNFRGGDRRGKNERPNHKQKKSGFGRKDAIGSKTLIAPHRSYPGVFVARGKEDHLCTLNMTPGVSVYNEKRIMVHTPSIESKNGSEASTNNETSLEYRVWNPYRSKLAAAMVAGLENTYIQPGSVVLYLGAASGTSVSHVSDMVGPTGIVYAVEFSQRSGRDLVNLAKRRPNIVPIVEDARHPQKYRMLVPMVDTIFSDVAQPDQSRIVLLNASYYLKEGGAILISVKANCVDCTKSPAEVFAREVDILKKEQVKMKEQVGLEPYEKDHAVVVGIYRAKKK